MTNPARRKGLGRGLSALIPDVPEPGAGFGKGLLGCDTSLPAGEAAAASKWTWTGTSRRVRES